MKRSMWTLAAAVPPMVTLVFVLAYGVDVPLVDEWNMIGGIAGILDGATSPGELARTLWIPHNEHVAPFPRAIIVANAWLTGWDLRVQMIATLGCFAVALWALKRVLDAIPGAPPWALASSSCLLFSLHGFENWLWGCQIHIGLAVLGVTGAIAILGRVHLRVRDVALAGACGIVGSWSFLSAFLVWPAGVIALAARRFESGRARILAFATWGLAAAVAVGLPYASHSRTVRPRLAADPGDVVEFVLRFVGAGVLGSTADPGALRAVGAIGVVLLVALGIAVLVRRRDAPAALALVALGAFGLASGLMIAIGRVPLAGVTTATASRYTAFSGFAWIAIVVAPSLLAWRAAGASAGAWRRVATLPAVVVVVALLVSSWPRIDEPAALRGRRAEAARAFASGTGLSWSLLGEACGDAAGAVPPLGERLAMLRRHGLSFFRGADAAARATPPRVTGLDARLATAAAVAGAVDVEVRGGVPGNAAFGVLIVGGRPEPGTPADFDDGGAARVRFAVPAGARDVALQVVSIDRGGFPMWSAPIPLPR